MQVRKRYMFGVTILAFTKALSRPHTGVDFIYYAALFHSLTAVIILLSPPIFSSLGGPKYVTSDIFFFFSTSRGASVRRGGALSSINMNLSSATLLNYPTIFWGHFILKTDILP